MAVEAGPAGGREGFEEESRKRVLSMAKPILGAMATGDFRKDTMRLYTVLRLIGDEDRMATLGEWLLRAGELRFKEDLFGKPGHATILSDGRVDGLLEQRVAVEDFFKDNITRLNDLAEDVDSAILNRQQRLDEYAQEYEKFFGNLGLTITELSNAMSRHDLGGTIIPSPPAQVAEQVGLDLTSPPSQPAAPAPQPSPTTTVSGEVNRNTITVPAGTSPQEIRRISNENDGATVVVEQGAADAPAAGTPTPAPTGSATSGGTSGGGGGGGTGPAGSGDVTTLPPGAQVWKIGDMLAVAYTIEEGDPSSGYVYYGFTDPEALNRAFPGGTPEVRDLTQAEADRLGGVFIGTTNLLREDLSKGWQEGFYTAIDRNEKLQPWLNDPEVLAVTLAATLEGRNVSEADLESTEYFASRSDAEIKYVAFAAKADADELEQYHSSFRESVRQQLTRAGVRDPDPTLVDFIARKQASAQWTESYTSTQIMAVANPFSSVEVDAELQQVAVGADLDLLVDDKDKVKQTVREWLGPQLAQGYDDAWVAEWAGRIKNDPNEAVVLTQTLKDARNSLIPFGNPDARYVDLAPQARSWFLNTWGQQADEMDPFFLDVMRTESGLEAQRMLREEGWERGVDGVVRGVEDAMLRSFEGVASGTVRRDVL